MDSRSLPLRIALAVAGLAAVAAPPAAAQTCPDPAAVTGGSRGVEADVRYLADDRLEGREVGSRGARCAADYLAARLGSLGLRPAGEDGSWFHGFPVRTGSRLLSGNRLEIADRGYASGREWIPLGFSSSEDEDGDLVYGGTLLSRPGHPDDRFAHLDLDGKIVVVEWGDPEAAHGAGMRGTAHFKATLAAARDAAGILVLMPEGAGLPDPAGETRASMEIPVIAVHPDVAADVRRAAEAGERAHVTTAVEPVITEARNVVALLEGSDPELRDEYVVVGAHYDHLGWGGEGSLAPDGRAVHNGADDNASGTAGVLEIARRLVEGPRPARSVLFMGFTGEEKGLWGSANWVEEPTVDLDDVVAMLNLDMVGRLTEDRLTVYGIGTAEQWEEVVTSANAASPAPMRLGLSPDGFGPSDHASFHAAGIPVLHFFTNTHPQYHRPDDDWERIEFGGIERVAGLAAAIVRRIGGGGADAVALSAVQQERPSAPGGSAASSSSSGYGPYLGTIPDMSPREGDGLRLTGVREGSPAEEAGLQAGDVVVEFAGRPVTDIYSYTYALRDSEPGDRVEIVVERDGERVTVVAVLGRR